MALEKLPTAGDRSLDPTTASVNPTFGDTARQGQAQGDQANRMFNDGLAQRSGNAQPGNSGYLPKVDGQGY